MADLGKEFLNTIKKSDERKTQPFDSVGTVTRVKDGVAYVHFAGGVDETPVKLTINAQAGDEVQVRVADGRAWLVGNATSPPTDDTQARRAINLGKQANDAAVKATKDAMVAHEAAESAGADAKEAQDAATIAESMATQARTDAGIAKSAADTAVSNLSQVQEVLEVVEWVAKHGTYTKATTFNPNATYYTVTATEVTEPSNADVDSHGVLIYYEEDDGIYVRTEDETVDDQKTYYRVTGTPVADPKEEYLSQYYTLVVSDAMADYIQSHLALTNEGLYVMKDGSKWKVKVADNGVYILDASGKPVNTMESHGNIIGRIDGARIAVSPDGIVAYNEQQVPFFAVDYDSGTEVTETSYTDISSTVGSKYVFTKNTVPSSTDGEKILTKELRFRDYDGYFFVPSEFIIVDTSWATTAHPQSSSNAKVTAGEGKIYIKPTLPEITVGETTSFQRTSYAIIRFRVQNTTCYTIVKMVITYLSPSVGSPSLRVEYYTLTSGDRRDGKIECNPTGQMGRDIVTTAPSFTMGSNNGDSDGVFSSRFGERLTAEHANQFAIGKYNDNKQDTAFEIGNGDSTTPSNAFTVDWDGNTVASGDIEDGQGNVLSNKMDKTIETKTYTSNGTVTVTKSGNIVSVQFWSVVSRSTSARTTVGTLPVGWRPPTIVIAGNISGNVGYGNVESDGKIQVFRGDGANQRVDTSLTYIATQ